MSYRIIWTPRALQTFNDNIDYLIDEWDQGVIDDFIVRTDAILEIIRYDPKLFPVYRSATRKTVVTKQIILYYRIVDRSRIDLITFWNVYQNPKKLKLK